MPVSIYHNPRCSKSRQALALLEERNIKPTVIEYLKTPPSKSELKHVLNMLNLEARDLLRKKESEYTELGLDNPALDEDQIIDMMIQHPKLIERPIVISDKGAVIGRPPENVLEILGD